MNIPQTANQKQSIIDSLLSIPGMLRASDLELKPQTKSAEEGAQRIADTVPPLRTTQQVAANDTLFADTQEARVERIRRLVRTPIASSFLDGVLAIAEIRDRIATESDSHGRSWAAIIHAAVRQSLAGIQLPSQEADLVRLAVTLLMTQSLMEAKGVGEDCDWIYRQTRSARAQMEKLNPEAALWLQYALDHETEEGQQTDKSAHLKALARRACLEAITPEQVGK